MTMLLVDLCLFHSLTCWFSSHLLVFQMATTNSITSSTSTTTLSPFDITTNSTTTYLPLNNQLIPPASSNLILPSERFYNPSLFNLSQQQQVYNASEALPGLLASILQNRDQHHSSSTSSLPLFCELTSNSLLSQQQQLLALIRQQNQSSPISQFYSTTDLTQQNYFNGIQAFESLTLANYQKLAANRNVGIKSEVTSPTSQINGIEALNIPPTIKNLNNNFSTNKQQSLASLEQQLLVLLNLQQQQPQHSQNDCTSNSNNLNVATVINNQQSTQQNSLESFHFKDDKIQERKNCSIRRSSSSVSYYKTCSNSNADVSEHFKRTFSGKWPKRSSTSLRFGRSGGSSGTTIISKSSNKEGIKEGFEENSQDKDSLMEVKTEEKEEEEKIVTIKREEKSPSSIFKNEEILQQKVTSGINCHLGQRVGYTVIRRLNLASEDKQVEEHFRKSLGDDRFKQIRNNQRYNQEDDTNAMDDDIDV
uniref:Uncharacterized protein n=1 Tax=Meloidogyne enterolobii TaxID=390850 RepID=A0A6V7W9K6_MELEN|nr:unnamed protein product [Meloidogyne enterolobii]